MLRTTELSFWLVPLVLYATEPRCSDIPMALCSHGDFRGDAVENCVGQVALGMAVQTGKGYSSRWYQPENRGLACGDSWSSVWQGFATYFIYKYESRSPKALS